MSNCMTKSEVKAEFKKFVINDPNFPPFTSQVDIEDAWYSFINELYQQGDINRQQYKQWSRGRRAGSGIKLANI